VATVANGGRRLAPHLVSGIYQSGTIDEMGDLVEEIQPTLLNEVALTEEEMSLIQLGFYQVVNGAASLTTGTEMASGASVAISAKTGTAEAYIQTDDGQSIYTSNLNVVAYAPSHNPQIALAVVFPNSSDLRGTVSHSITRDIINLYQSINPMN
jgi:penicillin-binding protein 2B